MQQEVQPEAPWTVFADLVGLRTEKKEQFIDLTELVAERVRRSGVRFGLACSARGSGRDSCRRLDCR